jgi:hypothetical protein
MLVFTRAHKATLFTLELEHKNENLEDRAANVNCFNKYCYQKQAAYSLAIVCLSLFPMLQLTKNPVWQRSLLGPSRSTSALPQTRLLLLRTHTGRQHLH